MKINILFSVKDSAWGGGNQFLKALRDYFIEKNLYEEDVKNADIVLFNSHHFLEEVVKAKYRYPDKVFIHRVDGPIFYIREKDLEIDKQLFKINSLLASGTVFQSEFSKNACFELGMKKNDFETTVMNAPNPNIFNTKERVGFSKDRKIRLIATSWSANMKKGFGVYKWLDENLNFSKYEMKFVGNTPIAFKNIIHIPPLKSEELAVELKNSDIFITASQKDPCSNSLIEALHCGLPVIALKDGGHPELVGDGGEVFERQEEIPALLEKIVLNYEGYQKSIKNPTMNEVGARYTEFFNRVYKSKDKNTKKISLTAYFGIIKSILLKKINYKIFALVKRSK